MVVKDEIKSFKITITSMVYHNKDIFLGISDKDCNEHRPDSMGTILNRSIPNDISLRKYSFVLEFLLIDCPSRLDCFSLLVPIIL